MGRGQQMVSGGREADLLDNEAALVLLADAGVRGALPAAAQLPLDGELVHPAGMDSCSEADPAGSVLATRTSRPRRRTARWSSQLDTDLPELCPRSMNGAAPPTTAPEPKKFSRNGSKDRPHLEKCGRFKIRLEFRLILKVRNGDFQILGTGAWSGCSQVF